MANRGDYYTVVLKKAHLEWGTHRYTNSRGVVYGEGYIKIPSDVAYEYELLNVNGTGGTDEFGKNLFYCVSDDGLYEGVLRAQGNQDDRRYAKQFSEDGDLKGIGQWYAAIGAEVGDRIKVTWTSPTEITIKKI